MKNKKTGFLILAAVCAVTFAYSRERGDSGFSKGSYGRSSEVSYPVSSGNGGRTYSQGESRGSSAAPQTAPVFRGTERGPSPSSTRSESGVTFTPSTRTAPTSRPSGNSNSRETPYVTRSYTPPTVSANRVAVPASSVQRNTVSRPAEIIRPMPEVRTPTTSTRPTRPVDQPQTSSREQFPIAVRPSTRTLPTYDTSRTEQTPAVTPTRTRPVAMATPTTQTTRDPADFRLPMRERPSVLTPDTSARTSVSRTPSRDLSLRQPTSRLAVSDATKTGTSIKTPETRLTAPSSTRNTSPLRFGTAGYTTRSNLGSLPSSASRLRSEQTGPFGSRVNQTGISRGAPERTKPGIGARTFSDNPNPASSSRYSDGRNSVYRPPEKNNYSGHNGHDNHGGYNEHHGHDDHHHGHHDDHWSFYFGSTWYGPAAYPGIGLGFAWGNGHTAFAFGSYCPTYYYPTRYYDSWYCGGWGYSNLYYDGCRDGWYGGLSYIYNPWPVYRTYYYEPAPVVVYEPAPVVIRTETVYTTPPPATTSYVTESPAPPTYTVTSPAPPPIVQNVQTPPQVVQGAPALPSTETVVAERCFCRCQCNRQRPCTCEYPCGAEFTDVGEIFDLSNGYESYAVSLNPETIWSSYAGLDRWDTESDSRLGEATVSTENTPIQ